jgi:hypothetical protein
MLLTKSMEQVILERLTVRQIVTNYSSFMEPEFSLLCSQVPETGTYPETNELSSPLPHTPFLMTHFNIIFSFILKSPNVHFTFSD